MLVTLNFSRTTWLRWRRFSQMWLSLLSPFKKNLLRSNQLSLLQKLFSSTLSLTSVVSAQVLWLWTVLILRMLGILTLISLKTCKSSFTIRDSSTPKEKLSLLHQVWPDFMESTLQSVKILSHYLTTSDSLITIKAKLKTKRFQTSPLQTCQAENRKSGPTLSLRFLKTTRHFRTWSKTLFWMPITTKMQLKSWAPQKSMLQDTSSSATTKSPRMQPTAKESSFRGAETVLTTRTFSQSSNLNPQENGTSFRPTWTSLTRLYMTQDTTRPLNI